MPNQPIYNFDLKFITHGCKQLTDQENARLETLNAEFLPAAKINLMAWRACPSGKEYFAEALKIFEELEQSKKQGQAEAKLREMDFKLLLNCVYCAIGDRGEMFGLKGYGVAVEKCTIKYGGHLVKMLIPAIIRRQKEFEQTELKHVDNFLRYVAYQLRAQDLAKSAYSLHNVFGVVITHLNSLSKEPMMLQAAQILTEYANPVDCYDSVSQNIYYIKHFITSKNNGMTETQRDVEVERLCRQIVDLAKENNSNSIEEIANTLLKLEELKVGIDLKDVKVKNKIQEAIKTLQDNLMKERLVMIGLHFDQILQSQDEKLKVKIIVDFLNNLTKQKIVSQDKVIVQCLNKLLETAIYDNVVADLCDEVRGIAKSVQQQDRLAKEKVAAQQAQAAEAERLAKEKQERQAQQEQEQLAKEAEAARQAQEKQEQLDKEAEAARQAQEKQEQLDKEAEVARQAQEEQEQLAKKAAIARQAQEEQEQLAKKAAQLAQDAAVNKRPAVQIIADDRQPEVLDYIAQLDKQILALGLDKWALFMTSQNVIQCVKTIIDSNDENLAEKLLQLLNKLKQEKNSTSSPLQLLIAQIMEATTPTAIKLLLNLIGKLDSERQGLAINHVITKVFALADDQKIAEIISGLISINPLKAAELINPLIDRIMQAATETGGTKILVDLISKLKPGQPEQSGEQDLAINYVLAKFSQSSNSQCIADLVGGLISINPGKTVVLLQLVFRSMSLTRDMTDLVNKDDMHKICGALFAAIPQDSAIQDFAQKVKKFIIALPLTQAFLSWQENLVKTHGDKKKACEQILVWAQNIGDENLMKFCDTQTGSIDQIAIINSIICLNSMSSKEELQQKITSQLQLYPKIEDKVRFISYFMALLPPQNQQLQKDMLRLFANLISAKDCIEFAEWSKGDDNSILFYDSQQAHNLIKDLVALHLNNINKHQALVEVAINTLDNSTDIAQDFGKIKDIFQVDAIKKATVDKLLENNSEHINKRIDLILPGLSKYEYGNVSQLGVRVAANDLANFMLCLRGLDIEIKPYWEKIMAWDDRRTDHMTVRAAYFIDVLTLDRELQLAALKKFYSMFNQVQFDEFVSTVIATSPDLINKLIKQLLQELQLSGSVAEISQVDVDIIAMFANELLQKLPPDHLAVEDLQDNIKQYMDIIDSKADANANVMMFFNKFNPKLFDLDKELSQKFGELIKQQEAKVSIQDTASLKVVSQIQTKKEQQPAYQEKGPQQLVSKQAVKPQDKKVAIERPRAQDIKKQEEEAAQVAAELQLKEEQFTQEFKNITPSVWQDLFNQFVDNESQLNDQAIINFIAPQGVIDPAAQEKIKCMRCLWLNGVANKQFKKFDDSVWWEFASHINSADQLNGAKHFSDEQAKTAAASAIKILQALDQSSVLFHSFTGASPDSIGLAVEDLLDAVMYVQKPMSRQMMPIYAENKAEAERQVQEEKSKLVEAEKLAQEKQERQVQEEKARLVEAEKLAQEEQKRLAQEKQERQAKEAEALLAKAEAEKLVAESAKQKISTQSAYVSNRSALAEIANSIQIMHHDDEEQLKLQAQAACQQFYHEPLQVAAFVKGLTKHNDLQIALILAYLNQKIQNTPRINGSLSLRSLQASIGFAREFNQSPTFQEALQKQVFQAWLATYKLSDIAQILSKEHNRDLKMATLRLCVQNFELMQMVEFINNVMPAKEVIEIFVRELSVERRAQLIQHMFGNQTKSEQSKLVVECCMEQLTLAEIYEVLCRLGADNPQNIAVLESFLDCAKDREVFAESLSRNSELYKQARHILDEKNLLGQVLTGSNVDIKRLQLTEAQQLALTEECLAGILTNNDNQQRAQKVAQLIKALANNNLHELQEHVFKLYMDKCSLEQAADWIKLLPEDLRSIVWQYYLTGKHGTLKEMAQVVRKVYSVSELTQRAYDMCLQLYPDHLKAVEFITGIAFDAPLSRDVAAAYIDKITNDYPALQSLQQIMVFLQNLGSLRARAVLRKQVFKVLQERYRVSEMVQAILSESYASHKIDAIKLCAQNFEPEQIIEFVKDSQVREEVVTIFISALFYVVEEARLQEIIQVHLDSILRDTDKSQVVHKITDFLHGLKQQQAVIANGMFKIMLKKCANTLEKTAYDDLVQILVAQDQDLIVNLMEHHLQELSSLGSIGENEQADLDMVVVLANKLFRIWHEDKEDNSNVANLARLVDKIGEYLQIIRNKNQDDTAVLAFATKFDVALLSSGSENSVCKEFAKKVAIVEQSKQAKQGEKVDSRVLAWQRQNKDNWLKIACEKIDSAKWLDFFRTFSDKAHQWRSDIEIKNFLSLSSSKPCAQVLQQLLIEAEYEVEDAANKLQQYLGFVTWDQVDYVLGSFKTALLTQPELSEKILAYRFDQLVKDNPGLCINDAYGKPIKNMQEYRKNDPELLALQVELLRQLLVCWDDVKDFSKFNESYLSKLSHDQPTNNPVIDCLVQLLNHQPEGEERLFAHYICQSLEKCNTDAIAAWEEPSNDRANKAFAQYQNDAIFKGLAGLHNESMEKQFCKINETKEKPGIGQ